MRSFTFDEQSVDRIANSVRWTEKQTVRQSRRENPTTLGSTFGHLLHVQVQGTVAENAFGTGLVYQGAAGSETPGTEQVHFVNKSGRALAANDDIWLCWPRIAGDHSGEAQAYWYSLTGGDKSGQAPPAARASFTIDGVDPSGGLTLQPGSYTDPNITIDPTLSYQINIDPSLQGAFDVSYTVSITTPQFSYAGIPIVSILSEWIETSVAGGGGVARGDVSYYSATPGEIEPGVTPNFGPVIIERSGTALVSTTATNVRAAIQSTNFFQLGDLTASGYVQVVHSVIE